MDDVMSRKRGQGRGYWGDRFGTPVVRNAVVVALRKFCSYAEIAKILGQPISKIHVYHFHGSHPFYRKRPKRDQDGYRRRHHSDRNGARSARAR